MVLEHEDGRRHRRRRGEHRAGRGVRLVRRLLRVVRGDLGAHLGGRELVGRVDVGAGRVEVLVGDATDRLARADVAEPLAREGRGGPVVGDAARAPKLDANVACTPKASRSGILGGSANASFSSIKPSRCIFLKQGDDTYWNDDWYDFSALRSPSISRKAKYVVDVVAIFVSGTSTIVPSLA